MVVPGLRFEKESSVLTQFTIQQLIDDKSVIGHLDGNHGELYPRSEEFTSDGVPYISANDFANGNVDFSRCKYLPLERAEKFKKGIAKNGDLLFAHNATVGPVTILRTDLDYVILSTTATYFRINQDKLSTGFLKNYFESDPFKRQYSRVMSQSTRNQVPITAQRKFKVNLPSLPEQRKIADFLIAVDEKIRLLTEKKDKLETYKKGVMQKLFPKQGQTNPELRFKRPDGTAFPDWEEKRLGEVLDFYGTNSLSRSLLNYEAGAIKNIHYGDIHTKFKSNFRLGQEEVPFINEDVDTSKIKLDQFCKEGDLVIADASEDYKDIGKAIELIDLCDEYVVAGLHTYIARDSVNNFSLGFKGYLFQTEPIRRQIMRLATGVSVLGISKTNLSKMDLKLPSIEEQALIVDFLTSLDTKLEVLDTEIDQMKDFKKGLLQQMFV